jgi:hypothetical protein
VKKFHDGFLSRRGAWQARGQQDPGFYHPITKESAADEVQGATMRSQLHGLIGPSISR